MQIPQKRVTKLINHHKVATFPPQPRLGRSLGTAVKGPWSLELPRLLC
jgi:plasmid maintenance system antidote protein VapI